MADKPSRPARPAQKNSPAGKPKTGGTSRSPEKSKPASRPKPDGEAKSFEKPAKKTAGKTSESRSTERPAAKSAGKTSETRSTERPTAKSAETRSTERPTAKPAGKTSETRSTERPTAKSAEKTTTKPISKTTGKTSKSAGKPDKKGAADKKAMHAAYPSDLKKYINVYFSLGSNIGKRRENLKMAVDFIHSKIGKIARTSHVYETAPWGKTDQDKFLNMVVMANTIYQPRDILEKITEFDREMGRTRTEKWGPRVVDIDIIFYGKRVIRDKGLEIPHPEVENRAFVLVPMMEIAPDLMHPVLGKQIDELYMECLDMSDVVMSETPLIH